MAKLAAYRAKRDFTKTAEPKGRTGRTGGFSFVVQKHAARRLHYDFRLELDGTLKSWAVAKGPSLVPGDKRLAVHVEDHPLDYGDFEGTIPAGEYGGGTVLLWDRGRWMPEGDPRAGYAKGHLIFQLEGKKLKGSWHLVRMRKKPRERQESWLLIKSDDAHARTPDDADLLDEKPLSVKTGRSLDEIAQGKAKPETVSSRRAAPKRPETTRTKAKASSKPAPASRSRAADPMPRNIAPSLATLVDDVPKGPDWLHEIKWDGYRLIAEIEAGKVQLKTRNGLNWTKRFPGIAKAAAALPVTAAILDGEAVIEDENGVSSFSLLQQALSNTTDGVASHAVFYAFDLLFLDGRDLRPLPLEERKRLLSGLVPPEGILRFSEHLVEDGSAMVRNACRLGLEGVVSKRRDRAYRSGRTDDWVKIKCTERQEFVIAGFVPSTATKKAIGSLVLGFYEGGRLIYAGRTGTGFTADLARDLYRRLDRLKTESSPFQEKLASVQRRGVVWVKPELIGEVEFRGWTADKVVRHAAFKGLREDKDARDVVQEGRPSADAHRERAMTKSSNRGTVEVAGVTLTHPDRVLWEEQGITKQGLAEFYVDVADWLMPHIADRPLALVRCPSGSQKACFFQKHAWAGLSEHVFRETVRDEQGEEEVLLVRDVRGVIALVQAGVLEIHPWGSTIRDIDRPDRITFDFDPGEGVPWTDVIASAHDLRERLKTLGLESFAKTTGGKGLHVVVPLTPRASWDEVKRFAKAMAETMEADAPDRYLTKATKSERGGKTFIDYLRNSRGATAVAAYSTRARSGAPVSTPLDWKELTPAIKSNHFTVANLTARLRSLRKDPWETLFTVEQMLPAAPTPLKRRRRSAQ
jgi:bifunctional non-homologous end joining protein LigD